MLNCAETDFSLSEPRISSHQYQYRTWNTRRKGVEHSMSTADMDLDAAGLVGAAPATGAENDNKKAAEPSRWLSTSSAESELDNLWVCATESFLGPL